MSGSVADYSLASRCSLAYFLQKVSFFEPTQKGSVAHLLLAAVLQWSFLGKRTPLQPQQQFSGKINLVFWKIFVSIIIVLSVCAPSKSTRKPVSNSQL
jgi:hypothetical protein